MTRKTTKQFILDAKAVHGDKYDYSNAVYVQAHIKVIIICPTHGEFSQAAFSHTHGRGCPDCGKLAGAILRRKRGIKTYTHTASSAMEYKDMVRLAKVRAKKDLMILPFI